MCSSSHENKDDDKREGKISVQQDEINMRENNILKSLYS